jgi:hypothetical protein
MDSSSPDPPDPRLQVLGKGASSVIVHRPPPDRVEQFLELQRGITEAAKAFPGYEATEVYPPPQGEPPGAEWVVVIHFDTPERLQGWLDSAVRAQWVAKLRKEMGDFRLKTLPAGFGAWFAGQIDGSDGALPPSWKIALTVLFQLYPTVMVLAIFVSPHLNPLGLAVSMLISNALSISILQWAVTPALNKWLGPWVGANEDRQRTYSLGGLVVILLLLLGMALLFRLVTG